MKELRSVLSSSRAGTQYHSTWTWAGAPKMPWNQFPEMAHVASYTAPDKLEQLRQLCLSPAASMPLTPYDRKPLQPSEHPGLPFTSAFPASHNLTLDPGTLGPHGVRSSGQHGSNGTLQKTVSESCLGPSEAAPAGEGLILSNLGPWVHGLICRVTKWQIHTKHFSSRPAGRLGKSTCAAVWAAGWKIHTHFNATTFYLKEGLIEALIIQTWQTFSWKRQSEPLPSRKTECLWPTIKFKLSRKDWDFEKPASTTITSPTYQTKDFSAETDGDVHKSDTLIQDCHLHCLVIRYLPNAQCVMPQEQVCIRTGPGAGRTDGFQ